jgi:hypothetical protein
MKTETAIEQLKHASKNPGTLPSIACMKAILKEVERLKNEIADGYCLAYNSLPDREMEDQEDDLCAQINRLTEYIKRRQGEIERLRADNHRFRMIIKGSEEDYSYLFDEDEEEE